MHITKFLRAYGDNTYSMCKPVYIRTPFLCNGNVVYLSHNDKKPKLLRTLWHVGAPIVKISNTAYTVRTYYYLLLNRLSYKIVIVRPR